MIKQLWTARKILGGTGLLFVLLLIVVVSTRANVCTSFLIVEQDVELSYPNNDHFQFHATCDGTDVTNNTTHLVWENVDPEIGYFIASEPGKYYVKPSSNPGDNDEIIATYFFDSTDSVTASSHVLITEGNGTNTEPTHISINPTVVELSPDASHVFSAKLHNETLDDIPYADGEVAWMIDNTTTGMLEHVTSSYKQRRFTAANHPGTYLLHVEYLPNPSITDYAIIEIIPPSPTPTPGADGTNNPPQPTNSPTPTPVETTTDTTSSSSYHLELLIDPRFIVLEPLQKRSLTPILLDPEHNPYPLEKEFTYWELIQPIGEITMSNESASAWFTAGDLSGLYENVIALHYHDPNLDYSGIAYATVEIYIADGTNAPLVTDPNTSSDASAPESSANPADTAVTDPSSSPQLTPIITDETTDTHDEEGVHQCLIDVYGPDIYHQYFDPAGEQLDPARLGAELIAAERCFNIFRYFNKVDYLEQCVINILGKDRYNAIAYNGQTATATELKSVARCFNNPRTITYQDQSGGDESTNACLTVKLGKEELEKYLSQMQQPDPAIIELARECYNLEQSTTRPPLIIQAPSSVEQCLIEKLGDDRYHAIVNERKDPSETEKLAVETCFNQIEVSQRLFLPPLPELIPFIEADPAVVQINKIRVNEREYQSTIVLSGRSLPDTIVDIYIFSDPIVVTTKTDQNGDWHYELSYHIADGDHEIYSVVHHPEKGLVKSEVSLINVATAQTLDAAGNPAELLVVQQAKQQPIRNYLTIAVGIALMSSLLILGFYYYRATVRSDPPM